MHEAGSTRPGYALRTTKLLRQSGFCIALRSVPRTSGATHAEPIAPAIPKTALTGASWASPACQASSGVKIREKTLACISASAVVFRDQAPKGPQFQIENEEADRADGSRSSNSSESSKWWNGGGVEGVRRRSTAMVQFQTSSVRTTPITTGCTPSQGSAPTHVPGLGWAKSSLGEDAHFPSSFFA